MTPPSVPDITAVFELAGWCAAEALQNLSQQFESNPTSNQRALLPSLVIENGAKKRFISVFDSATPETFKNVESLLRQLSPSDKYAVLSSDGYVTFDGRKFDSVNLDGHLLVHPRQSFCLALPYECPKADRPFTFRGAKIVSYNGFNIDSIDISGAVVRGREKHPNAAAIWDSHFRSDD